MTAFALIVIAICSFVAGYSHGILKTWAKAHEIMDEKLFISRNRLQKINHHEPETSSCRTGTKGRES